MDSNAQTPGEGEGKLKPSQTIDAWLKLIGRYDFYIGSVNTKAALLVAFNTFVAGGLALKWQDIQRAFGDNHAGFVFECLFLIAAVGSSLVSLWYTFRSVNPFLASPSIPNQYHSVIFFGDVVKFPEPADYQKEVEKLTEPALVRDLTFQAHVLAKGLTTKFADLRKAIGWVIYGQIPALALSVLAVVIVLIIEAVPKIAR